jgi:glycosyltransferase involved in cell wall biosynthesis
VIFTGTRDDVPDVLSALDVFVLSSATEGLAMTLLEAMAAGLPVIATSVGGNVEVVVDGATGRLVPPRDSVALGGAIADLLEDVPAQRRFGDEGRRRVSERFSIATMVRSYEQLYDAILARAGRSVGHERAL